MSERVPLETFTAGAETAVDVAGIERQLRDLWQAAAASEQDAPVRAVTRACLFNFVVLCETAAARDHATATIGALTSHHPCRAIVMLIEPAGQPAELTAAISAHCHLAGGGGKQVCCEQISIHATGSGVGRLTGVLLPLLEADLPTIVWWAGNFLREPDLFRRIVAVANRLLYDSSSWPAGGLDLTALALAIGEHRHCLFADLSWTRLNQWRALTAGCFDDPRNLAELGRIESVRIVHGSGPGAGLRGLLFAGWVAAQLNWAPRDAMARIRCQAGVETDGPGAVRVDPAAAGLLAVELRSPTATFRIRKNHGEQTATVVVATAQACGLPRVCAFWPEDDAALISWELDHRRRQTVYERALEMAAALAEAGQDRAAGEQRQGVS